MTDTPSGEVQAPDAQGQPAETPDQSTSAPAVAAPEAAPAAQGDGPWASDLSVLFQDEGVRGQVDTYLRDKVQPYVTDLETRYSEANEQAALYRALDEDPIAAYLAITDEIFDGPVKDAVVQALQTVPPGEGETPQTPDPSQPAAPQSTADPRVEEVYEFIENQKAERHYAEELARVKEANPDIKESLFHSFVAGADGDFDVAVQTYQNFSKEFKAEHGITPDQVPDAPVTLDGGTTTPPTEKHYSSLGEAADDFFRELDADRAPATVG